MSTGLKGCACRWCEAKTFWISWQRLAYSSRKKSYTQVLTASSSSSKGVAIIISENLSLTSSRSITNARSSMAAANLCLRTLLSAFLTALRVCVKFAQVQIEKLSSKNFFASLSLYCSGNCSCTILPFFATSTQLGRIYFSYF